MRTSAFCSAISDDSWNYILKYLVFIPIVAAKLLFADENRNKNLH
jgi:hypothetical protein